MARLSHVVMIIAMNALMCVLAEEELYSDRYDNIDILAILNDDNERISYHNCFMKIAPCQTLQQATLTGMFSEAYYTKCKRCTEKQKQMVESVSNWYKTHKPENWQLMLVQIAEDMKNKNVETIMIRPLRRYE